MRDLIHWPVWPLVLILGYPALTIAFLALARGLAFRAPFASGILHQVVYLLLPTGGIWLILHFLAELPADDWAVRVAETIFALSGLYMLLRVAQSLMMSLVDEQMRAPRLLLDILRIILSLVWGSVVVSRIWNVNLGSLLAAMGVGSIALALTDCATSGCGVRCIGAICLAVEFVVGAADAPFVFAGVELLPAPLFAPFAAADCAPSDLFGMMEAILSFST